MTVQEVEAQLREALRLSEGHGHYGAIVYDGSKLAALVKTVLAGIKAGS